jgi:toxin FitB
VSYLLDTCVISEPTKPKPATSVLDWIRSADSEALYLSVLTLGEIERGVARIPDSQRKRRLRNWFEQLRSESEGRILDVNEAVAIEWGRIAARAETQGITIPVVDALLGATAIVNGLTVVTRNTSDIVRTGVPVVDPWQSA